MIWWVSWNRLPPGIDFVGIYVRHPNVRCRRAAATRSGEIVLRIWYYVVK